MRIAAIDIGSNTLGLVVADVAQSLVRVRFIQSPVIGLGADVAQNYSISEEKLNEVTATVKSYVQRAHDELASNVLLFGTAAMRNAANGDLLAMMIGRDCGVPCYVVGEDTEARFAFTGATTEFGYADRTLVIDLGGASTECVVGAEGQIENWMSLPMGAGVAASSFLTEDPPSRGDLAKLASYIHDTLVSLPIWSPQHALITGGTALNLGHLLDDPNDRVLDSAKLDICRQKLHSGASATVAATYQIDPTRARVLQAGVEIVDELMKHLALETMEIAVYGVNDGAILSYLEDPSGWWETRVLTA